MRDFANSAFTETRRQTTFSLQMLKDKVQRREIGNRVKELRERSPYTQKLLADRLHVGLRQYQNYENPGVGEFDIVEQIVEVHWEGWAQHDPEWGHVSAGWLWDGKDRRKTPDVLAQLDGDLSERLARIEAVLEKVRATQVELRSGQAKVLEAVDRQQRRRPARRSPQRRGGSGQAASGN